MQGEADQDGGVVWVFIDESGKPSLGDLESDPWYVLAAVIVDGTRLDEFNDIMDRISRVHFGGSPAKSSLIGPNHERRLRVVADLCEAQWTYSLLAVRKSAIFADSGLRFRKVMHKFMTRLLIDRCARLARPAEVVQDRFSSEAFMDSVSNYIAREAKSDLFFTARHTSAASHDSRGIQAADLVAGTMSHWIKADDRSGAIGDCRQRLRAFEIEATSWPLSVVGIDQTFGLSAESDAALQQHLHRLAAQVSTELNERDDPVSRQMAFVLDALAFAREFEDEAHCAMTALELMERLVEQGLDPGQDQAFRNAVIAGLRERGVIVAGDHDGYRLALSAGDIETYLEHTGNVVLPMLRRLEIARGVLLAAGTGHEALIAARSPALAAALTSIADLQFE